MAANQDRRVQRYRGFTLLELMVVIGIVALLLAIVLPSFVGARRQARVIQCASNLRQICAAMHAYAMDNRGQWPDLTSPGTGGNLWDVSNFYVTAMRRQNVDFRTFLCPAEQLDPSNALAAFNVYSTFKVIEYSIWIPRRNGADVIPPAQNYGGSRFVIVSPRPTSPFAGPASVSDTARAGNPVITDIVGSGNWVTPPANADASLPGNPYQFAENSNHMDGDHLRGANCGFMDGHVEFHNGNEVHPYYMGNWWNWR
jgi:prepilin-type N-terminal cleavage/methylation domain-containing protein/prepilin-type processing-associated H-X9-DG protein